MPTSTCTREDKNKKDMEIKGTIVSVLPIQSGVSKSSGKEWRKQEYVLETLDEKYPKKICFSAWGAHIDEFVLRIGDVIEAAIELESREYQGRWYTEVRAWRCTKIGGAETAQRPQSVVAQPQPAVGGGYAQAQPAGNDLPF